MLAPADAPEVVRRVEECIDLVDLVVRQMARDPTIGRNIDDLRSAGREGLLMAARSYDAERGVPFRRWANLRIRGAIMDAIRDQADVPRRVYLHMRALEAGDRVQEALLEEDGAREPKTSAEADERLGTYLAGIATAMAFGILAPARQDVYENDTPEDRYAQEEVRQRLREVVNRLPEAERHIMKRHYFEGIDVTTAAKEIGLSKSWASRLHARAIDLVTRELRKIVAW